MSAALKIDSVLSPKDLIIEAMSGRLHICQMQGWKPELELQSAELVGKNPELFFARPAVAALWPGEWKTRNEETSGFFRKEFFSSAVKAEVLNDAKKALQPVVKVNSFVDEIMAVADEFVTNALYNAPFVDPVTFQNKNVDRTTTQVELPPDKPVRLFFAEDGARLFVGISDEFGSLNIGSCLKRIGRCYETGLETTMNFGKGGAGIGSYIVFNSASSMYYGVLPGKKTVLGCVLPLGLSRQKREEMPKHLHWIKP